MLSPMLKSTAVLILVLFHSWPESESQSAKIFLCEYKFN